MQTDAGNFSGRGRRNSVIVECLVMIRTKDIRMLPRFLFGAGLVLVVSLWLVTYFPWFYQMEQESFFCYLPVFHEPFWLYPGGPVRWAARFLIQFFHWDIGTAVVFLFLSVLLASGILSFAGSLLEKDSGIVRKILVWLVAALVPLCFFLFSCQGIDGMAVGLSLVSSLWLAVLSERLVRNLSGSAALSVNLLLALSAYYLLGPLSVFFVLAVSFSALRNLLVLPLLLFAAWLASRHLFCTFGQCTGYDLWKNGTLLQKTALAFLAFVLFSGAFRIRKKNSLSVRNNRGRGFGRKVSVRTFREKHPGNLFLPLASTFALVLFWLLWGLVPLTSDVFPVRKIFYRCERAADNRDWDRICREATAYFDAHLRFDPRKWESSFFVGDSFEEARAVFHYRELLAVDLKLALLKSGRLNRQFLSYGGVPEMNMLFPAVPLVAGRYNIPHIRMAWHTGLFVPMRIYTNNLLNAGGLSNAGLRWIIPNSVYLARYALAGNYLYYQAHTLAYRSLARYWQAYNSPETAEGQEYIARNRQSGNPRMVEEDIMLDFWARAVYTPASDTALLEYRCMLDLLYKKIGNLPAYVRHYRRLGFNTLPAYLQEGLLILQDYDPDKGDPIPYSAYAYSNSVLDDYVSAVRARRLWQEGRLPFSEIRDRFGSTYFFHYYFRTFY